MFVKNGPSALSKALLLSVRPNGEWRSEHVEYYKDLGPPALQTDADIAEYVG